MTELPAELTFHPTPLVGLFGLDIKNLIHHSVWEAFNSNHRPDTSSVRFKLFEDGHAFPTVKPKRNSYEWYVPKGILKRNWMNKYLNEIPALAIFFYNLDWHDSAWNEKKLECSSRVQSLRAALEGRNTKIAVVLIQKDGSPSSSNEDPVATERATALCAACEVPAKTLYSLPFDDHLISYTLRLEQVFYDLAQGFYHQGYKIVKSHREQLNKTIHQYLFVRHHFKMGFYNDLKQDQSTALKHYQQAYNNLLDVRIVDANSLEIKTVASFINYKLCRLMFNLGMPKDSIAQFRSHIDRFKTRTGPQDLIFEHHAWMSNQYSTFAELFDEAIRQGLPAVQTQHPGYYYQIAATHATQRKLSCKQLCCNVNTYPNPDPLAGEEKLEFYGQRPWRPGKLNAEPADINYDAAAIQALQHKEINLVNHSTVIIGLLGNAISQFKIYRCPRMRRLLIVQMAEEYFQCKDFGKVLTLLMHMLWEYRTERWPVLLTEILKNALNVAYLSASIQEYITLALEALGPSTMFSIEQKNNIYSNLLNILQRKPPYPELDVPENLQNSQTVLDKWMLHLNRIEPYCFMIGEDDNMTTFIDVKARFTQPKYLINSPIIVEIFVKNFHHDEVQFCKILLEIISGGYSYEYMVPELGNDSFRLSAKETKQFFCQFEVPEYPDKLEIQISKISVHFIGSIGSLILKFPPIGREINYMDRIYPEIQCLRREKFDSIVPQFLAKILQPESNVALKVDSNGPALLGEWFPIEITVSASEFINKVHIFASIIQDSNSDQLNELSLNMEEKHLSVAFEMDKIDSQNFVNATFYFRAHNIGLRNFNIKVEYLSCDTKKNSKELNYSVSVIKPFDVATQFYTMLYEPLTKSFTNEPVIIMPHITCSSVWPIEIECTSFEAADSMIKESNLNCEFILKGTVLNDGETGTDVYCITPKIASDQPRSTGIYTIRWKRANSKTSIITSSSVTLSPLTVDDTAIGLRTKLPSYGWVRTPLCVSYFITNHSDYLIKLKLSMEASDAFMFAGHKQIDISILPESEKKLEWILRPLVAGFVALPTLSLSVSEDEEYKISKSKLAEIIERSVPSHIYIMPKSESSET